MTKWLMADCTVYNSYYKKNELKGHKEMVLQCNAFFYGHFWLKIDLLWN
jgi:hypothetical protein